MKVFSSVVLIAAASYSVLSPTLARADEPLGVARRDEIRQKVESIKTKSKERVEELKKKTSEKTAEVRTKACEARKNNIDTRLKNRVEAARRHQVKFNNIYEKVKVYAEEKSLASDEIRVAESKASAEKLQVSSEIATLEAININIDCSNPDNAAETIDAYKNQLESVKVSLKSYRESIRVYSQTIKKLAEVGEGV